MRRLLIGSLCAIVLMLGIGMASPAYAHDALAPSTPQSQDRDKRDEASKLTDELRFQASRPSKTPAIQAAVAGKAQRRRDLLNSLARTSPSVVLELALTPSERAKLPPQIRSFVEERVDLDGELHVMHVDFEDGHSDYDARLAKGGRETKIRFGASLGQAKPGDYVKSSGVALSGDPTVVTDQPAVVQSTTGVGTTGNQRTAIILVMAPGVTSHPYASKDVTASVFFSSTNVQSARRFYQEVSYGQTTIVGANGAEGAASDIYGPFSIATSDCDTTTIQNQALAAADPTLNFNSYDRIVISIANSACGNGGVGTIRTQSVGSFDGATQRMSVSWDFGSALGSTSLNGKIGGVALHEFGHNLGVWHANALECGSSAIGGTACYSDEYGDPADVMGSSSGYGHFNGVHKDILGWTSSRAQMATASGTYTLNPYEDSTTNVKILKLPRTRDANGAVTGYYYLEYRKPSSTWDDYLSGHQAYDDGVLVHTSGAMPYCTSLCNPDFSGAGGGGDSNLIDTEPGTISGSNDFRDAALVAGETYTDSGAGVTIQVVTATSTGATVSVTYSTPHPTIQTVVYPEGAGTVSGGGTFTAGQSVTLAASPANCFVGWRENRASQTFTNPYTFAVGGDRTLEAVFTDSACAPPPSNDTFPGATVSTGQQTVTTSGATVQTAEPTSVACDGATTPIGRTAWYTVTPQVASQVTLTTAGSDFDTVLAVYTGSSVGGLTLVGCSDDIGSALTSQVQFNAQAGVSYRVQLGGYDGDSGDGVLNVALTPLQPDPRQEGAIQVSGDLKAGGTATLTVAVKNYGGAPTPATHPYVDGSNTAGQAWHADGSQPASAVIQPGQTVSFALHVTLNSLGTWTSNSVSLWNNDSNAFWQILPANGQSQQISFQVGLSCSPRPKISVQAVPTGDGRLSVTITAGSPELGNRLTNLQYGTDARMPNTNALLDLPGFGTGRSQPFSFAIPSSPVSYTFYVRRQQPGLPVTVPITITDGCGPWQTLVGGGTAAGF
mgnify:CR=1 FL=1